MLGYIRIFPLKHEGNRNSILHANLFTILLARFPVGHCINHSQGLGIERGVNGLHHLWLADTAILLHNECHDDTPMNASLRCFFRVLDILAQEFKECLRATRILRHFLHYVEDITLNRFECTLSGRGFRRFSPRFCFHNLECRLVIPHIDGCIFLAFLRYLLLRAVVTDIDHFLGIDGEGYGDDRNESQQFQETAATGFCM